MYKPECAIHQEKVKQYYIKPIMSIVSIKTRVVKADFLKAVREAVAQRLTRSSKMNVAPWLR